MPMSPSIFMVRTVRAKRAVAARWSQTRSGLTMHALAGAPIGTFTMCKEAPHWRRGSFVIRPYDAADEERQRFRQRVKAQAGDSEGARRLHVDIGVADQEAAGTVDCKITCRLFEQAGARFAAVTGDGIGGDRSVGVMRTIIERIDACTLARELFAHVGVQLLHGRFVIETARHAGLIGDHDDHVARGIEEPDGFGRARNPCDLIRPVDVTAVDIEDPVAVEEGGGPRGIQGSVDLRHTSKKRVYMASMPSWPVRARRRSCFTVCGTKVLPIRAEKSRGAR